MQILDGLQLENLKASEAVFIGATWGDAGCTLCYRLHPLRTRMVITNPFLT